MRHEHTTMVLHFKIKLKKDFTKNASMHLCSISEVAKPSSKMTLIFKNSNDLKKKRASEITYTLPWQFFNTNKSKRNIVSYIAYYCTLILFRTVSKWEGLYHSYTKTVKHFTDQIQNGGHLLLYWKKPALGMVLQKFILVNLRFLYKDNLKKDCIHNALMHIWTKKQKAALPVRCKLLTKFSFAS